MRLVNAVANRRCRRSVDQGDQIAVLQGLQLPICAGPDLDRPQILVAGLVDAVAVVVLPELQEYNAVAQAGFLLENAIEIDLGGVRGEAKAVRCVEVVGKKVQHANQPIPSDCAAHAVVGAALGAGRFVHRGEFHVGAGLEEGGPVRLDGRRVKRVQYNAFQRARSGHLDGAAQRVWLADVPQFDGAIFRGEGGELGGLPLPRGVCGIQLLGLALQAPAGTAGGAADFQDPIRRDGRFSGEVHRLAGAKVHGGGGHLQAFADFEIAVEVPQIGAVGGEVALAGSEN